VVIAVLWHLLQRLGSAYVERVIGKVSEMNGVFALVLGLMALLYLAATMGVLGLEVNVVINRRLFPRALLTPFTDAVRLTDADRRAYASYAKAQRHKGFQHVDVTYDDEEGGTDDGGASGGATRVSGRTRTGGDDREHAPESSRDTLGR
jgi:hypothetical protein